MSTGAAVGSQSLDCNSAQQKQRSSVKTVEGNHLAKSQPSEVLDNCPSGRVTLRSDTNPTLSKNKLLNLILSELSNATDERVLEYKSSMLEQLTGLLRSSIVVQRTHHIAIRIFSHCHQTTRLGYDSLLQNLRVIIMSTALHDSHVPWFENSLDQMLVAGFLTIQEKASLERYHGTIPIEDVDSNSLAFKSFGPPYQASRKEPDYAVKPIGSRLPTLVFESGWSESRPQLYHDRDLWLRGGQGFVQVILIIKWTANANKRVKGDIEVFDLDIDGNPRLLQHEIIFPAPDLALALSQHITVTRHQLFGPNQPAGQNRAQFTHLSLNDLRVIAARNMGNDGYTPA
ncbi:hypothetical protein V1509DRAFT_613100 [Lipomyces kononenkoae]